MVMILSLLIAFTTVQDQKIFDRLVSDDVEGVRRLIEARPEFDKTGEFNGRPLLAWASSKEMVELLISKGVDPNVRDKEGKTALAYHIPSSDRSKPVVETLLRHGADPNATRGGKAGLVRVALSYRGEETALQLLQHDSPYKEADDLPNSLQMASQFGMTKVVKKLLDLGVKVDVPGHYGFTALHSALMGGHDGVARLLIDAGADVNAQSLAIPDFIGGINRSYNGLRTPLLLACSSGMTGTARILLAKGAKVDARDQFGLTPLHHAARVQNVDLVRLLLEHKADVDATVPKKPGMPDVGEHFRTFGSPLHLAVEGGSRTLVEVLLQAKADVRVRDGQGRTVLHRLLDSLDFSYGLGMFEHSWPPVLPLSVPEKWMKGDRDEVLKSLIQAGADVNAKDHKGVTPLRLAVDSKNVKAAEILRKSGARD
jgi:ankyrin repeat protein